MKMGDSYSVRPFDLHGLLGISDGTIEMHIKLYEGYVQATNQLTTQIGEMLKDGRIDHEEMPAYSELTRRLGFEYNGMVLHEYYFENLQHGGATKPDRGSAFMKAAEDSFGSYDMWKLDFSSVGKMRGVGWAVCSLNQRAAVFPITGSVSMNMGMWRGSFRSSLWMYGNTPICLITNLQSGRPTSRHSSPTSRGRLWRSGSSSARRLW
jgi:superoxide dismutase